MPLPVQNENTLAVLVATVGFGQISVGSTDLHDLEFRPLPGRVSGQNFSPADVGRIVMVLGADAEGNNLVCKIAAYVAPNRVTLDTPAATTAVVGTANVFVFRPVSVKEGSIQYENSLTTRGSGSFSVRLFSGDLPPVAGQPFLFTSTDPLVGVYQYGAFFGGEVDSVSKPSSLGETGYMEVECSCLSYEAVAMRRIIQGQEYSGVTITQIADDIRNRGLKQDFFDLEAPEGLDPLEGITTVDDNSYVGDALDRVMEAGSTLTSKWFWKVSPYRKIVISRYMEEVAPWHISDLTGTDSNILVEVKAEESRDKFSNQIYIEASKGLGPVQTYTTTNIFAVIKVAGFPLGSKAGAIPQIKINGVTQPMWVSPVDPRVNTTAVITIPSGYKWAWPKDSDYVFTNVDAYALAPGQTIEIKWRVATPVRVVQTYAASVEARASVQGGSGLHETVIRTDTPLTMEELNSEAERMALRLGLIPIKLSTSTFLSGLRPGQSQTVHLSEVQASMDFLVESVQMRTESGYIKWEVAQSYGSVIGDWRTALVDVLGGRPLLGGSGGGVSGSNPAAPSLSGETVIITLLGNKFRLSGKWTTPADTSNLMEVVVRVVEHGTARRAGPDTVILQKDFTLPDTNYETVTFDRDITTDKQYDVLFLPVNKDGGVPAVFPVSTITVLAPKEASITGSVTSRYKDKLNGSHVVITYTPVVNDPSYPFDFTLWRKEEAVWKWSQVFTMTGPGSFTLGAQGSITEDDLWVPDVDESWRVAFAIGKYPDSQTSPPARAVQSAPFTVAKSGKPPGGLITAIQVTPGDGGTYPYNRVQGDLNLQDWWIEDVYLDISQACVNHPDAQFVTITAQDLSPAGSPIGAEHRFRSLPIPQGPGVLDFGDIGGPYGSEADPPRSGPVGKIRLNAYLISRGDVSQTAWTNNAASTLEVSVIITVSVDGSTPATEFPLSFEESLGPTLHRNADGSIDMTTTDPTNIVANGDFETGDFTGWVIEKGSGEVEYAPYALWTKTGVYRARFNASSDGDLVVAEQLFHPCKEGDVSYLEAWRWVESASTGDFRVHIRYYNGDNTIIGSDTSSVVNPKDTWVMASLTSTAPANTVWMRAVIWCVGHTVGQIIYADSVVFRHQIPYSRGVVPNDKGGVKLNVSDTSNILLNGGFENYQALGVPGKLPYDWESLANSNEYVEAVPGFSYSGNTYIRCPLLNYSGVQQRKIACRAGDRFRAEAWIRFTSGSVSARARILIAYHLADDTYVGGATNFYDANFSSGDTGWVKLGVTALAAGAPAGTSTITLVIYLEGGPGGTGLPSGSGSYYIDNALMVRVPKTGRGQTINETTGEIETRTGTNTGFDGGGNLVIPNGTMGEAVFVGGALGNDMSKWHSNKQPFGYYSGFPSPFDSNVPPVIINIAENPWRVYNRVGGAWIPQKTQPGDLVTGNLTATVSVTTGQVFIANGSNSISITAADFIKILNSSGWSISLNWLGLVASVGSISSVTTPGAFSTANGSTGRGMTYGADGMVISYPGQAYNSSGVNGQFVINRFPSGSAVVTVVNGVIVSIV